MAPRKKLPASKAAPEARAIDTEVLPNTLEQKLINGESEARDALDQFTSGIEDATYRAAWAGSRLLHLRDLHCRQSRTQFKAKGADTLSTPDEDPGFLEYLKANFCKSSVECDTDEEHRRHVDSRLRMFRRLMNVARHATLNGDSQPQDLQHVRAIGILSGKSLTDLYKPLLEDTKPEQEQRPKPSVHATYNADLSKLCSEILTLKDDCPADFYDANHTLLKSTLEAYTGTEWVPAPPKPTRRDKQKAARKRKKLSPKDREQIAAAQRARWAASRAKK